MRPKPNALKTKKNVEIVREKSWGKIQNGYEY